MSRVEEVWSAKPLLIENHYKRVYSAGPRGQLWDQLWTFDRVDDGAARIKLHSDNDGIMITVAIGGDYDGQIDSYVAAVSFTGGPSIITHANRTIARIERTPPFPTGRPAWLWFRFLHGFLWIGYGDIVGQNVVIGGKTPNPLAGMYRRFGIGKIANNGAFELLDVQPLERRLRTRWDP